jgi:hypothetical protein
MAYEDYLAQIAQNRTDVGQRIANLPQFETNLREQVFGADQSIPSLRTQISSKVNALYDVDKRMADVYSNPNNPMYIRDPYQRDKYASTQHQAELGTIGDLQNMLGSRQDILGNAIDKGMKIYQAGIDAAKFEQESLLSELDAAIKVAAAKRAGSGTATPKYRYSELVRNLMTAGNFDPKNYPNIRTDEKFLSYLEANPEADYKAAQLYLPDLISPSSPVSELKYTDQQAQGEMVAIAQDQLSSLTPTDLASKSGNDLYGVIVNGYPELDTAHRKMVADYVTQVLKKPIMNLSF